jgi:pimeloyl-ACP methyl ester carboxylesterase
MAAGAQSARQSDQADARMASAFAQLVDTLPAQWRIGRMRRGAAATRRPGIRFLELDRCVVRLREAGEGARSLVFAADPPVPLERYDALIATLGPRHRISVFELPGFGCSLPRVGFRYGMAQAVDGVIRVLQSIPGAPHVLVMPCVTGFIAMRVAAQRPDLVHSLVLPQVPDWDSAQQWLAGRDPRGLLRRPLIGQLGLALLRRRRVRAWYAGALADRAAVDAYVAQTLASFDDGACFGLASAFQDFLSDASMAPMATEVPALHLWGDADRSHRDTDPQRTRLLVPNARLIRRAHCGHFPELEDPVAFAADLHDFLDGSSAHVA